MSAMKAAIQEIDAKIAQLQQARATLVAVDGGVSAVPIRRPAAGGIGTRRPMTEEAKQKIREAQAKRWGKQRAEAPPVPEKYTPAKPEPDKAAGAGAGQTDKKK